MLSLFLAIALGIPPRIAEVPVTGPALQRQPLSQNGQRIASNGSLALCAWNDKGDVVASRIDANGTPMDTPGVVIADQRSLADVFWNGDAFVVVANGAADAEFVFLSVDGAIANRVTVPFTLGTYAANTSQGADTRVLLLPFDGYTPNATLLDARAEVVKKGSSPAGGVHALAAWNGERFLVVRDVFAPPQEPFHLSEVIDRDGNVLSSQLTGVPFSFSQHLVLSGDAHGGFVLFDGRTMYRLDGRGVVIGNPAALQAPQPLESSVTRPFATVTDDGFIASWAVNLTNGRALTFVSRNGGAPVKTYDWPGRISSAVVDPRLNIISAAFSTFDTAQDDVFVQKGSAAPQLVTVSAPLQTDAALAAGSNGFLAAWVEVSESSVRVMARRFSQFGAPQGEASEAGQTTYTDLLRQSVQPRVVFGDDVYLIVWNQSARRMDARTGEWLDAAPFSLPFLNALGSNGQDALAVMPQFCAANTSCLFAQRIAMRGSPLAAPAVPLIKTANYSNFALASNGTDYLIVYTDGEVFCGIPEGCGGPPVKIRILASRVRSDGTLIDAAPLVLSPDAFGSPSAAWDGRRWVAAWVGTGGEVRTAFISAEGAVQAGSEVLGPIDRNPYAISGVSVIGWLNADVVIATHRLFGRTTTLAIAIGGETSIVRDLPDTSSVPFGPVAAAANGSVLMFAYDRIDNASGHVDRVFLDPRLLVSRRRIAR